MKIIIEGTAEEISDLVKSQNRIHFADTSRSFEEIKPKLYACVEEFCGESDNLPKQESLTEADDKYIIDYHQRSGTEVPDDVKETPYVSKDDLTKVLEQLQKFTCVSSKIRNMKLSELVYITNQFGTENAEKQRAVALSQLRSSTSHADMISNIVREYSKRYSESLQGNLSDKVVEKISSIMALFADASFAEATEVIEHVKNIVLNELPKYTKVNF